MTIAAHHSMLDSGKPYKCELEYLESTGTEWIDTGIAFSDTSHTYKWEITAQSVNKSSGNYKWFCGYFTGHPHCCGAYNDTTETSRAFYPTGKYYANGVEISSPMSATDKKYDVVENIYSLNGLDVLDTLTIFTRRDTRYGTVSASGPLRVYVCKLYDNNTIIRDFIPVLDLSGVPCMYDKVSGKLFYNQGTGSFVAGPEIWPVEWIESTGTQWIETGVVGRFDTIVELDNEITSIQNGRGVFGAFASAGINRSLFLYVTNSGNLQVGAAGNDVTPYLPFDTDRHLWRWVGNVVYKDGIEVFRNDYTYETTFQTLLLGNLHNASGGVYTPAYQKIYRCRIGDVRSFIPVRIGSGSSFEGAMLDTVERKVYRNAGTGSFIIGPEAA